MRNPVHIIEVGKRYCLRRDPDAKLKGHDNFGKEIISTVVRLIPGPLEDGSNNVALLEDVFGNRTWVYRDEWLWCPE